MLHWLIRVGCQRPTSKVFNFKNYICIFQCRENYTESTKVQRWCWLVLGDLQPVCHAVPVGVDDLNGDRAKDGLIFSPPCPILLWFSLLLWKVFYIYFFCMYKHTNILMARPSCGGQRTTFMSLFSIFFMWIPRTELRLLGLAADTLPCWATLPAHSI